MKIQEIDDLAYPNSIHQIPRSSAEEKGKGQGMEGITVLDLPVDEEDSPYGYPGNDSEKDGSYGMGRSGQQAKSSPGIPYMGDMKKIPYDFDRLEFIKGSLHIGLGNLIEKKDPAKYHDQDEVFLPQDGLFPSIVPTHRWQMVG
jgi:hypothetical protein